VAFPLSPFSALIPIAVKSLKYVIDNNFRDKVYPLPGSVLYSDLYIGAEHSGIYIGDDQISNIVVDGFAESEVKVSTPRNFTDSSKLHRKIYVSCDGEGAVGEGMVSDCATKNIGLRSFYGLLFSNCHVFSEQCVNQANGNKAKDGPIATAVSNVFELFSIDDTWEPSVRSLKRAANRKLGATKWRLWDWDNCSSNDTREDDQSELDLDSILSNLYNTPLDQDSIQIIQNSKSDIECYFDEISNESLPSGALNPLRKYKSAINKVWDKYQESKIFIQQIGHGFSFNDLRVLDPSDFTPLAHELKNNQLIKGLVKKLGRNYISPEKKYTVCKRMKSEVHGIHKSNEIMRLLPSELSGFDNEELEYLFYAKLMEHSLLTYQLTGSDQSPDEKKMKGPVVACFDTSASMGGLPIIKAKALLLAISQILEQECRDMYVLIFGSNNQIKELKVSGKQATGDLLKFLYQGFDGGTDFETPLTRAVEIISQQETFKNSDILMVTDGECSISGKFSKKVTKDKQLLGFSIFTVICDAPVIEDSFSDEIVSI